MSLLLGPGKDHSRPARVARAGLLFSAAQAWHEADLGAVVRFVRGTFLFLVTGLFLWVLFGALFYGAFILAAG